MRGSPADVADIRGDRSVGGEGREGHQRVRTRSIRAETVSVAKVLTAVFVGLRSPAAACTRSPRPVRRPAPIGMASSAATQMDGRGRPGPSRHAAAPNIDSARGSASLDEPRVTRFISPMPEAHPDPEGRDQDAEARRGCVQCRSGRRTGPRADHRAFTPPNAVHDPTVIPPDLACKLLPEEPVALPSVVHRGLRSVRGSGTPSRRGWPGSLAQVQAARPSVPRTGRWAASSQKRQGTRVDGRDGTPLTDGQGDARAVYTAAPSGSVPVGG